MTEILGRDRNGGTFPGQSFVESLLRDRIHRLAPLKSRCLRAHGDAPLLWDEAIQMRHKFAAALVLRYQQRKQKAHLAGSKMVPRPMPECGLLTQRPMRPTEVLRCRLFQEYGVLLSPTGVSMGRHRRLQGGLWFQVPKDPKPFSSKPRIISQ